MPFGIASFRSRQQVFAFEAALSRAGIRTQVVSTPREVALGCGLSVRFALEDCRVSSMCSGAAIQPTSLGFTA